MLQYRPTIQVLHVEDRQNYQRALRKELIARGVFVHTVSTLQDARNVFKVCDVRVLVCDGMFPVKKGQKENKSFIPLQEDMRKLGVKTKTIAWANSTHVHEYCRKYGIPSYSKIELKPRHFTRRGRDYFRVKRISAHDLLVIIQEALYDLAGLESKYRDISLSNYYTEPATVFAIFMAADMRTAFFKKTAGRNYGPMASIVRDGEFSLLIDASNDALISKSIFEKIVTKNYFPVIKREINERSKKLLLFSHSLRKTVHTGKTNKALARSYLKFADLFMGMRMYSSLPTAMEQGANKFTELLGEILGKNIRDVVESNKVLSELTTPAQYSYLKLYEIELAKIAISKAAKKSIDEMVKSILERYAWIRYAFQGVPITKKDILSQIHSRTLDSWKTVLREAKVHSTDVQKKKGEVIKRYPFTAKEQALFEIGADIVFIKYFRKGVFAESYYCVEFLFEEIARRIGIRRDDVSQMTANEVLAALNLGSFSPKLLQNRRKRSVLFHYNGATTVCSPEASVFLNIKRKAVKKSSELRGQVAYPGIVKGVIRIVNVPSELAGFIRGEIMVSRSTNPSLVSAMEKAAAIITDMGGLTCHAAIVAREMKKPCIVGTKIATEILKNGDSVEVDAEQGVILIKHI